VLELDLSHSLREAAEDVVGHLREFGHIRVPAVEFALFRSRQAYAMLNYARCYALEPTRLVGRRWYRLQPFITAAGVEARYILAFALPRYFELSPPERLETLVHELYHIAPEFDGRARSFGNQRHHGPSKAWFDEQIRQLCAQLPPDLAWQHHALALELQPNMRVRYRPLVKPKYVEIGQGK
jgi:predicted metallopeptidase